MASMDLGKAYALLIGVSKYHHLRHLSTTTADVYDLRDLLVKSGCYPTSNLVLLSDEQATRGIISDKLDWLARRAGSNDTVLVFFSGHGIQCIGGLNPGEYLCPVEADLYNLPPTTISDQDFTNALHAIRAARIAVFLDSCHSGGVGEPKDAFLLSKPGLSEAAHARMSEGRGRMIIASCEPDEVSWSFSDMRNSLFTHYLLEGLRGAAADAEGMIRILDLFNYISRQVPQRKPQHPYFKAETNLNFAITTAISAGPPIAIPTLASKPSEPVAPLAAKITPPQRHATEHSLIPYGKKLREVMSVALSKGNLELLCADLEFGAEFVGNGTSELECQRVIDECKRSGRGKMGLLLHFLRSRRPDRAFPDLPPDEDLWWAV